MNYILLNEGFYAWLEVNYLPLPSQILFLKFIHAFNLSGWSEWLQIDNQKLMSWIQTNREETAINNRDKLLEKGLLVYIKGKKGVPNKYKFNDKLAFISEASTGVQTGVKSGVNTGVFSGGKTGVKTEAIYKQNKTKQNKESISTDVDIPKKSPYGNFSHVFLTEQEYSKLISKYKDEVSGIIQFLDDWIEMKGFYKSKSHYLAIKKWVITAFNEQKLKEKAQKLKEKELSDKENRQNNYQNGGSNYGQNEKYWSNYRSYDHKPAYEEGKINRSGEPWCTEYPE
ncbi:MAG: hypothetical protein Pg6B_04450 [Candidatus Azobacteroides pseudotrichonymphae]|uniref:Uncharacterized protein n=1 Tax=Candidatus Improbicoccus pseudotrichonymphae TaxID=3033792 RepID=A0AA48I2G0_9FIRM|nr:MAG: hypothetical protein CfP315_0214 [Candidatus Improbicoccus pseudotrichonymphae]GMO34025.1 MAG: hypothetical protein Pg6B_04450 [Candidatus Azobacteroides pseudotrichonymphae]